MAKPPKVRNIVVHREGYTEILICKDNTWYSTLLDTEDSCELGHLHLNHKGYAHLWNTSLHRKVMKCVIGDGLQVDHINGNKLDNRKINLRLVDDSHNKRNLHSLHRSKTGVIGIKRRKHKGLDYFIASWSGLDKSKHCKCFNIGVLGEIKHFLQLLSI